MMSEDSDIMEDDPHSISRNFLINEEREENPVYSETPGGRRRNEHERIPLLTSGTDSDAEDMVSSYGENEYFTVEEAVEHIGFGNFQWRIFFTCGLFSATDALEMLLLSVLSPVLRCDWMLSEWDVAFLTTIVFIGMFLGSNLWGKWADQYGRLPILKIAALWICYFGILTSFSPNYYWILVLRGLVGSAFGGAVQSFTLQSEYLPSKYRAKILIISNCMWALGSTFEVLMAYLIIPRWGWRGLVAVSALPTFITIFAIWFLPESARFLVASGRKEEALSILQKAARINKTSLPPGQLVQSKKVPQGQFKDLFSSDYRRTTLQVWLLWFGTASSYYGIILLQSEILERNNVCSDIREEQQTCHCNPLLWDDYLSMIFATLGEFVVIPINLLTIDTIGRKWTLTLNFLCSAIFFMLVQICTTKVILTLFIFGVRTFSSGIFNAVYIYTSEVFPTPVRSLGLGSSSAMARVGAMLTPFFAQVMMEKSVKASIWTYGILCSVCAVCAALLPIETKGREMPQSL